MHRFAAGVGLLALALSACGSRVAAGPPPHIVAVGVAAAAPVAVAPAPEVAVAVAVAPRADRGSQPIRLASATIPAGDDVWTRLAQCESGGNPRAVGGRGRFYGAFQFMLSSWRSVGMTGNPIDYPYEVQLAAAKRLQAQSGWKNWPVCSRRVLR